MTLTDVHRVSRGGGAHARSVPYERVMEELSQDPEFVRAYEEQEPEFQIIRQVIALRNARGMTQAELAERAGTRQSSIARMESKRQIGNLHLLQRVAEALDARVEVRLVPRKAAAAAGRAPAGKAHRVSKRAVRSAPGHRGGKSLRA